MRIYRAIASVLTLALIMPVTGCSRKNNPIFGPRDNSVTAVQLFIPQIDTTNSENNRIFASVVDQLDNPVTGFKMGNFSVLEGGEPGVPFDVSPVTEPLFLMLVIDRSGSMGSGPGSRTEAANAAAVDLVNALSSSDYAAILEFESTTNLTLGFTNDKTLLINTINAGGPLGATALYDGTVDAANYVQSQPGRRLLLVLTDGEDNASAATIEGAISHVNRLGLSAYMVGLGNGISEATVEQMGRETGGDHFTSTTGTDLSAIFLSILSRFNNMYYIKYRRRSRGSISLFVNYGDLSDRADKALD